MSNHQIVLPGMEQHNAYGQSPAIRLWRECGRDPRKFLAVVDKRTARECVRDMGGTIGSWTSAIRNASPAPIPGEHRGWCADCREWGGIERDGRVYCEICDAWLRGMELVEVPHGVATRARVTREARRLQKAKTVP